MAPAEHPEGKAARQLLVVSHTFPPYRGIGGRRWAKFAKALARRGWQVHVIHSDGPSDLHGSLWCDDVATPGIITHPLPQRYPTVLFKRPITALLDKLAYRFWSRVMPLLAKGNWYDKAVLWRRPLLAKAQGLIDRHGIGHVVVTGAPFRLMSHLCALRQSHPQVKLIADFRDPWSWGHFYGHGSLGAAREQHERALEASVAAAYHTLISPSPAIVEHLQKAYGAKAGQIMQVPHAIDPDEIGGPVPVQDDGRLRMVYAGSLYGAAEADAYFEALLEGFQRTRELYPEAFGRCVLDLYITGHGTERLADKVRAAGLQGHIRFHAPLPPKALFPIVAQAHLVLIFIPSMNKDFMGTKFNEIFWLRRPVVHIGEEGGVSTHITRHRLGISLRVAELPDALPRLISGAQHVAVDPGYDLSAHLLDAVTERLEKEVLG